MYTVRYLIELTFSCVNQYYLRVCITYWTFLVAMHRSSTLSVEFYVFCVVHMLCIDSYHILRWAWCQQNLYVHGTQSCSYNVTKVNFHILFFTCTAHIHVILIRKHCMLNMITPIRHIFSTIRNMLFRAQYVINKGERKWMWRVYKETDYPMSCLLCHFKKYLYSLCQTFIQTYKYTDKNFA